MKTNNELMLLWANGMSIPDILDLRTHELAEKIREYHEGDFSPTYTRGLLRAADLIDSEVEK